MDRDVTGQLYGVECCTHCSSPPPLVNAHLNYVPHAVPIGEIPFERFLAAQRALQQLSVVSELLLALALRPRSQFSDGVLLISCHLLERFDALQKSEGTLGSIWQELQSLLPQLTLLPESGLMFAARLHGGLDAMAQFLDRGRSLRASLVRGDSRHDCHSTCPEPKLLWARPCPDCHK
jgi:hypothetical protein